MAIATTPAGGNKASERRQTAARRDLSADRAREFRRAKRHSVLVQALKAILPAMAAGLLSLYALPSLLKIKVDNGRGTASVRAITLEAGSLKMIDPRVAGVNDKNDAYEFTADSATQASRTAEVMYLEHVRGRMTGQDGAVTTLTAPDGVHDNKADKMTFNNGVVVKREPDYAATFQTATAFMKQQMVVSQTPVEVRLHESTIVADSMTLFWGEQRVIFEGRVRTHIERQENASSQQRPAMGWSPANTAEAPPQEAN